MKNNEVPKIKEFDTVKFFRAVKEKIANEKYLQVCEKRFLKNIVKINYKESNCTILSTPLSSNYVCHRVGKVMEIN